MVLCGSTPSSSRYPATGTPSTSPAVYWKYTGKPPQPFYSNVVGAPGLTRIMTSVDFVWSIAFCAADEASAPAQAWIMLAVGALISFLGVPAGLLGNELSIRYGLRNVATLVFLLSAVASGLFGFTAMLPYIAVIWLAIVIGFAVQGNFANLTSGVLAVAAPQHRGTTIGLYSCVGFGGGFLGTVLFGVTLDQFGGTSQLAAWTLSFGTCGLACLAGAAATIFLSRDVWQRRT